jgi:hypothetical protein
MPQVVPMGTVAQQVREALAPTGGGEAEARRLAFGFVAAFDAASPEERAKMVQRPPSTGDPRYDALLAALVEHLCAQRGVAVPAWVDGPDRFLEPWWFVSGLRRLHASALAQSPISFARRGIFICDGALDYA